MKFLTEKKLQKLLEEHTQAAMIDRARYYENEILKKQTELLTLQNQINPHFCITPWSAYVPRPY